MPVSAVLPTIRTLPLPDEAQELFSRAVSLVTQRPADFASVGTWLDKHYSESTLRTLCEKKYRHDFAYRLYLLRRDSHTFNRRLAMRRGCPMDDVKRERVREALMRGERLEGTKLVGKSHPGDTVVDESNVHLVFAWEDEQYRRQFREIKAERKAAKLDEYDHPEKPTWRLARAVGELIEAEYPDPPEHAHHSRRIVGVAALLVGADPLPSLGEFGRWAWESKPDMTWESDPANPRDDFWRWLSQPPAQDGPHKTPLHILHARHEGREEVLFQRMPGKPRELQHQWGDLSSFYKLLGVAVDELEAESPARPTWDELKASTRDAQGQLRWPERPFGTVWSQSQTGGLVQPEPAMIPPPAELAALCGKLVPGFNPDRPHWQALRAKLATMHTRTGREWEQMTLADLVELARPVVEHQQQTAAKPIAIEGHFSPAELATKYGVDPEATRKALDRWRSKNAGGDGYTENPDRRPNEPQFLYSLKAVASVMEGLKTRAERRQIRRTKTSGQRPARSV